MSIPTWIDGDFYAHKPGDIGYLVESLDTNTGRTSWWLSERPIRTNRSLQPRIAGWCGETDNRSRYARGVARVVSVNKAGDRIRIACLTGKALAEALEADGYPELIPAD
jgi:hypothetical protein